MGVDTNAVSAYDAGTKRLRPVEWENGGMRISIGDAPGLREYLDALGVVEGPYDYEAVAASQTDQVVGVTGAAGDYLKRLLIVVTTAATAQVQVRDGSLSAITVFPNSPGGGIGTYPLDLEWESVDGPWKITTGAGVSVVATYRGS